MYCEYYWYFHPILCIFYRGTSAHYDFNNTSTGVCMCMRLMKFTPAEMLCGSAGVSDAAAKRDSGSVPSSIELSGSRATELEEEDVEEVLPFRPPRRDLESVT